MNDHTKEIATIRHLERATGVSRSQIREVLHGATKAMEAIRSVEAIPGYRKPDPQIQISETALPGSGFKSAGGQAAPVTPPPIPRTASNYIIMSNAGVLIREKLCNTGEEPEVIT